VFDHVDLVELRIKIILIAIVLGKVGIEELNEMDKVWVFGVGSGKRKHLKIPLKAFHPQMKADVLDFMRLAVS